jgi:hypothetical protein
MAEEEVQVRWQWLHWCRCCRFAERWASIDPVVVVAGRTSLKEAALPGLVLANDDDDLDEFRGERRFVIQLQAVHKDNRDAPPTPEQLQPMTISVYGKLRFELPLRSSMKHDPVDGITSLLAIATPETYTHWVTMDHWPHMENFMLGNCYRIRMVARVPDHCTTAADGLNSLMK